MTETGANIIQGASGQFADTVGILTIVASTNYDKSILEIYENNIGVSEGG